MNVVLWGLQGFLALFCVSGGAYKLLQFEQLAQMPAIAALPRAVWSVAGGLEVLCGVLLIAPLALRWMPVLTPAAAAVLALEGLILTGWYAHFSLQINPANPMVWTLGMALLAAFVAYGRYALVPAH